MTSDTRREAPPRCRVLHGSPRVVRTRGAVVLEGVAHAVLQRRRPQHTDRQPHPQGHAPLRRFEGTRCGPHAGGVEDATATFHRRVTRIASEQLLDGQAGLVEGMGGEEDTPLPVDTWRMGRDGGGKRPCNGGVELGRSGALVRSSPPTIAWGRAPSDRVQAGGLSTWHRGRQGLRRRRCPGKSRAAQRLDGVPFLLPWRAQQPVDWVRRLRGAMRRGEEPHAWGDATLGRGPDGSAIATCQGRHGLRVGLRPRGVCVVHGRRATGHPRALGRGERLEVDRTVEGTLSTEIGGAVEGVPRGPGRLDERADRLPLTAMPPQGVPPHRNARLVRDNPCEPHVVEGGPMVPSVPRCEVPDRCGGRFVAGIAASTMEAGARERRHGCGTPQPRSGRGDQETVERRDVRR